MEDTDTDAGVQDSRLMAAPDPAPTRPAELRRPAGAAVLRTSTLHRRVTSSRSRNKELRIQLHEHRLTARRRLEQARTTRDDVVRRRAALAPARPACPSWSQPAVSRPDAERLLDLHAGYAATGDPVCRTELAARYDSLALGLARRFPSRREAPEDLAQVARLGLLKALDRFDPGRGRPFVAFARATIVGELKRHIRDRTWSMRVPRSLQEQYLRVARAVDDLTQQLGRSPRIPEVAERAGLTEEHVIEALEVGDVNHLLSLDVPAGEADGRALDPGCEDSGFAAVDRRALLRTLLARLSDRERQVLHLRFVEGRTQAEIAKEIGVSQMYVSRLLSRTLSCLRARAG